ncbi:MAG TPA: pilus assembly protein PilM, partial [Thermoanaerobacterales bacterium]|nr:pilus assembly protein PilM [Thermoanaerobacterales bacterium]
GQFLYKMWHLVNCALVETPANAISNGRITDNKVLSTTIKNVMQEKNIREKKAIIAISCHRTITRYITMPNMPVNELKEAIKWEAKNHIPVFSDNLLIDGKILKQTEDNKLNIVLAGLDKNTSYDYLNMLQDAGLDPIAIDIYPAALKRLFSSSNVEEPYCIVDIGASLIKLIIINKGTIYADNVVHFGNQSLIEDKTNLGVIDEIRRFLQYFSTQNRGENVKSLILTGGGALHKNVGNFMTGELNIPSIKILDFHNFDVDFEAFDFENKKLHLFSNAIGLAMRGVVI